MDWLPIFSMACTECTKEELLTKDDVFKCGGSDQSDIRVRLMAYKEAFLGGVRCFYARTGTYSNGLKYWENRLRDTHPACQSDRNSGFGNKKGWVYVLCSAVGVKSKMLLLHGGMGGGMGGGGGGGGVAAVAMGGGMGCVAAVAMGGGMGGAAAVAMGGSMGGAAAVAMGGGGAAAVMGGGGGGGGGGNFSVEDQEEDALVRAILANPVATFVQDPDVEILED